jgi:ADP-ribose diphosphatase
MPKTIFESSHLLVMERDRWEYVERKQGKSAAAIVAVTDDGKLVLTEQYRRPVDARVIDLPAGLVGDDDGVEDAEETARKELEEETGYACDSVELMASGPTSPGITSELVSLYRARGLRRTGEGGGVGNEKITVHLADLDGLAAWLAEKAKGGVQVDLKVWAALYFLSQSKVSK